MQLYSYQLSGPALLYAVQQTAGMHSMKLLQESDYDSLIDRYYISTTYSKGSWLAESHGKTARHAERKVAAMRVLVETYMTGVPIDIPDYLMVQP